MSKYLEMLERKYELGLISEVTLNAGKIKYGQALSVQYKDILDKKGERQLTLIEKDKNWFIATELLSEIKEVKKSNIAIKGWITFIGVLFIIGIVFSFLVPLFV